MASLLARQITIEQQPRHAADAVHGCANLVAHRRQKIGFRAVRGFRIVARLAQLFGQFRKLGRLLLKHRLGHLMVDHARLPFFFAHAQRPLDLLTVADLRFEPGAALPQHLAVRNLAAENLLNTAHQADQNGEVAQDLQYMGGLERGIEHFARERHDGYVKHQSNDDRNDQPMLERVGFPIAPP